MIHTKYAQEAFFALYPHLQESQYEFHVRFSRKFSSFNANISYRRPLITISLSEQWDDVDESIVKGLFQTLYLKLFQKTLKPITTQTFEVDCYETFLEKLEHIVTPTTIDPVLLQSFQRVNNTYFNATIETPNLVWGKMTTRKMGSYSYQTDTISISRILEPREDLIDFVMFHEMLHKKHRYYKTQSGKHMHHHSKFKEEERSYPQFAQVEKALQQFVSSQRRKKTLFFWK